MFVCVSIVQAYTWGTGGADMAIRLNPVYRGTTLGSFYTISIYRKVITLYLCKIARKLAALVMPSYIVISTIYSHRLTVLIQTSNDHPSYIQSRVSFAARGRLRT